MCNCKQKVNVIVLKIMYVWNVASNYHYITFSGWIVILILWVKKILAFLSSVEAMRLGDSYLSRSTHGVMGVSSVNCKICTNLYE